MKQNAIRLSECIAPAFLSLHRDIQAREHAEYWLRGGRGSGKSSFVSLEIVLGMLRAASERREDTRGLPSAIVYRRVAATLRESVYAQIAWAIERLGASELFDFRLSPLEIRCRATGQRIVFRGADDPQKSKSIKLARGWFGFLWLEELSEFQGMDAVRTIQDSALRGCEGAIAFYTYNPPRSARNWVNEEALRTNRDRLVHSSSYLDVPPEWLGADFVARAEALRATNERAYRHRYLGEVTGSGGQVFDNLELRPIADAELAALDRRYCGLDFGFAVDPDAFVCWAYDRRSRALYAQSEFYGAHNSVERLAGEVQRRSGNQCVRCDGADPRMISELARRGVRTLAARKGPGSVEHGLRWLQGLGRIVIDPARTPNVAREFSRYEYARDRCGNFLSEFPDRDNHSIDATRYALEPEINLRVARTRNDLY